MAHDIGNRNSPSGQRRLYYTAVRGSRGFQNMGNNAQDRYLKFLDEAGLLKDVERTGWVLRKVPSVESVADHSWRMALMALSFPNLPDGVDRNEAIQMALIHDLPEATVGDLISTVHNIPAGHLQVTEHDKHSREAHAMTSMLAFLPETSSTRLQTLYNDYEARKSLTARFVKDLDLLEMAVQAVQYQRRHGIQLKDEFFTSVRGRFTYKETDEYFLRLEAGAKDLK